jgi:NAD(P)-dependent dehydrogenase (short-subunit alcohol dehydrogenase family)
MQLELEGKSVLITGASKGIGLACAYGFAAEGAHLHLAARSTAALEAAVAVDHEIPPCRATGRPAPQAPRRPRCRR